MKKNNKKGFTLVELLAVIIVLIVIVFLAFNKIKNSSRTARNNAIKASAASFIKEANGIVSVDNVENDDDETENGYFTVSELYERGLKLSGTKPKDGYVFVADNEVVYGCMGYDDDYHVIYDGGEFLKPKSGSCPLDTATTVGFGYTGSVQEFKVPYSGYYKVELWGAGGGLARATFGGANIDHAGFGGYTSGQIYLNSGETLYVYVGKQGNQAVTGSSAKSGASFNGGGSGAGSSDNDDAGGSGGGATDIRLVGGNWDNEASLASRIMVAGGGAGAPVIGKAGSYHGGYAGGLSGVGNLYRWENALVSDQNLHATQTSGYMFGKGQDAILGIGCAGSGAGGGYWGGKTQQVTNVCGPHGGGGSSYISGHTGCVAIKSATDITPKDGCLTGTRNKDCSLHYSGKVFTDTVMKAGNESMPSTDGSTMTGNKGNGYARITYLNANMDEIRGKTSGVFEISYTGSYYEFKAPKTASYKIELWGAQGGSTNNAPGGKGGYTKGVISLNKGDKLYLYVGAQGRSDSPGARGTIAGSFNGGASSYVSRSECSQQNGSGGGATDVRLVYGLWDNQSSLASRIMVAAGGGGSQTESCSGSDNTVVKGGDAGGLEGNTAIYVSYAGFSSYNPTGATQTTGGRSLTDWQSTEYNTDYSGTFGIGGRYTGTDRSSSGGGGGYFGGASGGWQPGAGGSSFISGHTGCVAITSQLSTAPKDGCEDGTTDNTCSVHYSNKVFTETVIKAGSESMPTHDGTSTMTGNSGNGFAKITVMN